MINPEAREAAAVNTTTTLTARKGLWVRADRLAEVWAQRQTTPARSAAVLAAYMRVMDADDRLRKVAV